ncbi:MAG: hypothetical protein KAT75_00675 [Dehalococcoidia bacterium]|nr:hypothetical protein [Dehalococcoidia bacterium]
METTELLYIGEYTKKVADAGGKLSALTEKERVHLKLLIRKYDLEQKLAEVATELSQGKLL